jgi:hypothetical protein
MMSGMKFGGPDFLTLLYHTDLSQQFDREMNVCVFGAAC